MAVFVGVVVALTGARHSSGGGCDSNSNSSSSSSSSGGSTHYDDDDDYDYDTGSSSGGGAQTSSGPSFEITRDVKIEECAYDAVKGLVARVRATNSSASTVYSYTFTVTFKDAAGGTLDTATSRIPAVDAGATETTDVVARKSASGGTCELSDPTRTADGY
ncbi:hypothetical protein [Streptomyces sp. NPDC098781]|uniref:hypothetical protein n=1 Tax=Streptomyces sp. NPDC098781 TaxID=3366097 RepID=UPI003827C001